MLPTLTKDYVQKVFAYNIVYTVMDKSCLTSLLVNKLVKQLLSMTVFVFRFMQQR